MSAVMSTLSMISGGRRTHRKLTASRKSGQFSDAGEERTRSQHDLSRQQRSSSLQTLEAGGGGGGVVNLESLEAKMASIEVSLASSRRRSGARDVTRELDALKTALTDKDSLILSLKKQLSASLSATRLAAAATSPAPSRAGSRQDGAAALTEDERLALEERAAAIRAELDARRDNIQDLRRKLEKTHVTENIDTRIQQAELQYQLGREELELLTLGEQARALDRLLQQATAASRHHATLYSTVRENGGSAWLVSAEAREGSWGAAPRGAGLLVDWAKDSAIRTGDRLVEVNGVSMMSCRSQEELKEAASSANPARLVVLRAQPPPPPAPPPATAFTQSEAASLRLELGALQAAAQEAERAKEGLRGDNTRLTHRISYLEDQVAELLASHTQLHSVSSNESCITVNKTKKNVTNISIRSEPNGKLSGKSEMQVFQKGPDITALVARLPALDALPARRPRSTASGASSRAAASPRASPAPPDPLRTAHSHHCLRASLDYSAETDAAIRMIERNQRHIEKQRIKVERLSRSRTEEHLRADSDRDSRQHRSSDRRETKHYEIEDRDQKEVIHYKIEKATDRIEEGIKKTNWAERKTLSIIEQLKRSQRLRKAKKDEAEEARLDSERHQLYRRIDGKVLENAHKSSRRTAKQHSRSAKSSELDSECSDFPNGVDYGSESCSTRLGHYGRTDGDGRARPTPPRKPLRLSLHKARSAHSLAAGSESESASRPASETRGAERGEAGRKPAKRAHGGERWSGAGTAGAARREPATPRPLRRALEGAPPAADDLYPDLHASAPGLLHAGRWC